MDIIRDENNGVIEIRCEKSSTLATFKMYHGYDVVSDGVIVGERLTTEGAIAVVDAMTALSDNAARELSSMMCEPVTQEGRR